MFIILQKKKKKRTKNFICIDFKEFLETLKSVDILANDWEVVFPDCPLEASEISEGVFSISG